MNAYQGHDRAAGDAVQGQGSDALLRVLLTAFFGATRSDDGWWLPMGDAACHFGASYQGLQGASQAMEDAAVLGRGTGLRITADYAEGGAAGLRGPAISARRHGPGRLPTQNKTFYHHFLTARSRRPAVGRPVSGKAASFMN